MYNECQIQPIRHTEDWFLAQLYMSNRPENETLRILRTLNRYVKYCDRNIFYSIEIINKKTIRFKPLNDLADDCLLTVSLFKKHIDKLHKRHSSPSFPWYVAIGTGSFERLGYYDIARNYEFWIDFIREHIFA